MKKRNSRRRRVRTGNPAKKKHSYTECHGCKTRIDVEHIAGHQKWCRELKKLYPAPVYRRPMLPLGALVPPKDRDSEIRRMERLLAGMFR